MHDKMKKLLGTPEVIEVEGMKIPIYKMSISDMANLPEPPAEGDMKGQAIYASALITLALKKSGEFDDVPEEELRNFPMSQDILQNFMDAINKVNKFESANKDFLDDIRRKQQATSPPGSK